MATLRLSASPGLITRLVPTAHNYLASSATLAPPGARHARAHNHLLHIAPTDHKSPHAFRYFYRVDILRKHKINLTRSSYYRCLIRPLQITSGNQDAPSMIQILNIMCRVSLRTHQQPRSLPLESPRGGTPPGNFRGGRSTWPSNPSWPNKIITQWRRRTEQKEQQKHRQYTTTAAAAASRLLIKNLYIKCPQLPGH